MQQQTSNQLLLVSKVPCDILGSLFIAQFKPTLFVILFVIIGKQLLYFATLLENFFHLGTIVLLDTIKTNVVGSTIWTFEKSVYKVNRSMGLPHFSD